MRLTEIIFEVTEAPEVGHEARAGTQVKHLHEKRKLTELLTKKDSTKGFLIREVGLGSRVRRHGFKRRHYRELRLVLLDVTSADV